MDRRIFLSSLSPFSEKLKTEGHPNTRTTAGIEPYTGPWDEVRAAHLLRRTLFGFTKAQLQQAASMTLAQNLTTLFAPQSVPSDPYAYAPSDLNNSSSTKRIYTWSEYVSKADYYYMLGVKAWWIGLMLSQGISLREKMTLFWHNHFVCEYNTVGSAKYMHIQNTMFRQNATGSFRTLVKLATTDPAMLYYLSGDTNTKGRPNENYARELQELFTVGKGPLIAPGNYTNYTEQDVQAAARVLTGWRDSRTTFTSTFDFAQHDTGDKTFSAAYQNTVIKGKTGATGANELDDLLNMIFTQKETAKYICRKLYRWFVYYYIDATIEQNIIVPMSNALMINNWEVKPVLELLLNSAHFFDDNIIGCVLKNPLDLLVGAMKQLEVPLPDPAQDQVGALNSFYIISSVAATQQMEILNPPNVAGWPAYYQEPNFHELWMNTATLPGRGGITDNMIDGTKISGIKFQPDVLALAAQATNPADAATLVSHFCTRLFAIPLTAVQKDYILTDVFLPGLPAYEWTVEWNDYIATPTNASKKQAVTTKLTGLLKFLLRLAEFQLS